MTSIPNDKKESRKFIDAKVKHKSLSALGQYGQFCSCFQISKLSFDDYTTKLCFHFFKKLVLAKRL
jgi:hypothetical protein